MNKILLVLKREYLTRVKKKSFIIMSILGPILFAAFLFIPGWLATMEDKDEKTIAVIDESHLFESYISSTEYLKFSFLNDRNEDEIKEIYDESDYYAILYIPADITETEKVQLYSDQSTGININEHISGAIGAYIKEQRIKDLNLTSEILDQIKARVRVETIKWSESGEAQETSTGLAMGIGYGGGFLIYFFIFMYGAMLMRGVIEEKTSRIVEVIVSSVKPFQLMMGKIVGIGLVAVTQFVIWVGLTFGIVTTAKTLVQKEINSTVTEQVNTIPGASQIESSDTADLLKEFTAVFDKIDSIPIWQIVISFVIYFLLGYLLYASLFAAVGAAVDNETDTQQFMLPITIPLILAIFVLVNVIQNPTGPLAFWFSIIPFTSPIVMMVRIPFEVPFWELALSISLLFLTFLGTTWMAGKIYRTGILMYGKKVNYAELWKWIRYKN